MITNQEIAVLKKMFRKMREKTDPMVVAKNEPAAPPKAMEIIAAQNVLRDCISVIFNECMPIDRTFIAEMALRLASYAVSVAPIEDQEGISAIVGASFQKMHHARMKAGIYIESKWVTDGVEHSNVPTKENTQ